jgi:hypothetical protein
VDVARHSSRMASATASVGKTRYGTKTPPPAIACRYSSTPTAPAYASHSNPQTTPPQTAPQTRNCTTTTATTTSAASAPSAASATTRAAMTARRLPSASAS